MPGISLFAGEDGSRVFDEALSDACFLESYSVNFVSRGTSHTLAFSGYDEYPVRTFDINGYTVVLEGYLYDADEVEQTLAHVTQWMVTGDTSSLRRWLSAIDGEFLLVVRDRSNGRIIVLNDALARLPTYRIQLGDLTIVSRELAVIRTMANRLSTGLSPDQTGLGQMLLLGYPLGSRTIFEGVTQLPPGTLVELDVDLETSLIEWRFDERTCRDRSIQEHVRVLRERFIDACENRMAARPETVISLSGGLDSRAVIAGIASLNGNRCAATSLRADGANAEEVRIAKQVATGVGVSWESYVADWTADHEQLLLETTQGMNNLSMSLGLDFVEQVATQHPTAMFLTGDGGDKALPDLTPSARIPSVEALLEYVVNRHQVFSPEEIEHLVDISREELLTSIRHRLEDYPESDPRDKYAHFLVRERGINWLNHGEDRTRYYLWSSTPFYAVPFFTAAMACPPSMKRGTHLYRAFLEALHPVTVEIEYADFNAPINSFEYRLKRFAYDWLTEHPSLNERLSSLLYSGNGRDTAEPAEKIVARMDATDEPVSYLSNDAIRYVTVDHGDYSRKQLYILYTLLSALTERDTLEPRVRA